MKRAIEMIRDLLQRGTSPEELALTIAIGVALGVMPILGVSTLLCALAAMTFGLNLPIIQIVNYVVYPLQIALLVPFLRGGSMLFGSSLPLAPDQLLSIARTDPAGTLETLGVSFAGALILWIIAAAVVVLTVRSPLSWLLRRVRIQAGPRSGNAA